jgi:hypothetical protein
VNVDAFGACQVARDRSVRGILDSACALLMEHSPKPRSGDEATRCFDQFLVGDRQR